MPSNIRSRRVSLHPTKAQIGKLKATVELLKKSGVSASERRALIESKGVNPAKMEAQWLVTAKTELNRALKLANTNKKLTSQQKFIIAVNKLSLDDTVIAQINNAIIEDAIVFQKEQEYVHTHSSKYYTDRMSPQNGRRAINTIIELAKTGKINTAKAREALKIIDEDRLLR